MKLINSIVMVSMFFVFDKLALADGIFDSEIRINAPILTVESVPHILSEVELARLEKEKECLAKNIYFEAAYEPEEGMIAVAQVTKNRVNNPAYPKTYCDVVWQVTKSKKTGKQVPQFSWTLDGKPDIPTNKDLYQITLKIAEEVLLNRLDSDIINEDVYHYHAVYVKPLWAKYLKLVAKIGNHLFYRS